MYLRDACLSLMDCKELVQLWIQLARASFVAAHMTWKGLVMGELSKGLVLRL